MAVYSSASSVTRLARCLNPLPLTDHQHIDPERLAALLDGRLDETEAAAVREQLAGADELTLSAFADAVAVTSELRSESPADVVPIESRRPPRRWAWPAAAIAAAAAIALVLVRPSTGSDAYPPSTYAVALPAAARASDVPVWGTSRGAGDGVPDLTRAARAGALLTDIELSAAHGDTSRRHVLLLANVLDGSAAGLPVAESLRALAGAPTGPDFHERTVDLGRRTIQVVDREMAAAGSYLEAARIAATAGDAGYFDRVAADALSPLERDARLAPSTRAAVTRFVALTRATPRDPNVMARTASDLLQQLTK